MEKLKEYKGITLIALVISIIVLLILAGVTINITLGENGLFNQTKLAIEKYKNAVNEEEEQLNIATNSILGDVSSIRDGVYLTQEQWDDLQDTIADLTTRLETVEGKVNNKVILYNSTARTQTSSSKTQLDVGLGTTSGTTYTLSEVPKNYKKIEITVGFESYNSSNEYYYYPYCATYEWDVETSPNLYLRDAIEMGSAKVYYQINLTNNSTSAVLYDQGHATWNGVYIKSIIGYK